jgi:hypothetical protein
MKMLELLGHLAYSLSLLFPLPSLESLLSPWTLAVLTSLLRST